MTVRRVTPILNVSSVSDSFRWFENLGWRRGFAWNEGGMLDADTPSNAHGPATFGSVSTDHTEIFLCVGAQGSRGTKLPQFPGDDSTDGVWMSWWIETLDELDAMHRKACECWATVVYPPTDEPWGVREFQLRHPDGHTFRVSCSLVPEPPVNDGS